MTQVHDITSRELSIFGDLVHDLAFGRCETDPRLSAAERITELLRAETLGSYIWDRKTKRFQHPVCVNHDMANVAHYVDALQFRDPLTSKMRQLSGAQIVDTVFPMHQLRKTGFYATFLKPADMYHGINIFFEVGTRKIADLRIWRGRNREPFGPRDVSVLETLAHHLGRALSNHAADGTALLSPREREIAYLVSKGSTDKEIAAMLNIGFSTVRTHVSNCFEKLGCANRAELSARLAASPA